MTSQQLVNDFIRSVVRKDLDAALALVADDIEYDNVPMGKVFGPQGVRSVLEPFIAGASEIDWVVHREASSGEIVFNERTDRFHIGGRWLEIPVVGVWQVRGGKIALWRDYFDMPTFTAQMTPSA
jgi:limonene-1,2-epoxide hydrolase